ncbi:MAG: hypothetical protein R3F20_02975 [Planctomycetota bacterium]
MRHPEKGGAVRLHTGGRVGCRAMIRRDGRTGLTLISTINRDVRDGSRLGRLDALLAPLASPGGLSAR